MDFNEANFKKLNQFTSEARRWNAGDKAEKAQKAPTTKRGSRTQPTKRKKKGKA